MRDFVEFSVAVLVLEELGYHRPFDDPNSAFFITEGKAPGPKGIAFEPIGPDILVSVAIFRAMLLDFGLDRAAVTRAIAAHAV